MSLCSSGAQLTLPVVWCAQATRHVATVDYGSSGYGYSGSSYGYSSSPSSSSSVSSSSSGSSSRVSPSLHYVSGYTRSNGTQVAGYYRGGGGGKR